MKTTYFNHVDGKPTLWDEAKADTEKLVAFKFADGRVGLLPADKLEALKELIEYSHTDEEHDYQENPTENHIFHSVSALVI